MSGTARTAIDRVRALLGRRRHEPESRPMFGLPELRAPRRESAERRVAVLVYQGVTTAEVDQPVRVLAEGMDADVVHVGIAAGPKKVGGVEPVRSVAIDVAIDADLAAACDVMVLPGGLGWKRVVEDAAVLAWVAATAEQAAGVLTISTGSLILAAAGQLTDRVATGHWLANEELASLGAEVSSERTARSKDSRIVTASGIQAAMTAAPRLADRVRWGT